MNQTEPEDLPEVHLQDVTEDETLEIAPPANSRKKKLLMIGGLVVLLLLTAVGGYFLLSGKEVNVRAVRKTPERVTNGGDLQQAAYDSLRGSLTSPPPAAVAQSAAANIGSNQPTTIAMAGMTPSPTVSPSPSPKPTAPIQSGIALTIAPPPEVTATNSPTKPVGALSPPIALPTDNKAVSQNAIAISKPKTDASIVFASLPAKQTTKNESPTTAYHDGPQPFPLPTPPLSLEKSLRALPSFGALLPVRLLGMLYTLRPNTVVRMELLRDSKNEHWQLPRGTIFVGAVQGAGRDRAYVQIKGFIDPTTERFTKLDGEALGNDGGAGLRGKERRLSSVWLRVLDRAAQTGTQLLTSLLGRNGSQVIIAADPAGMYRSAMSNESSQVQNNRSFVEVAAGTVGFVLVTTLPTTASADAPSATNINQTQAALTDAELADLFSSSDPTRIRAALPRLTPEVRRVVEQSLKEMEH
ncbi:MAG: hypothetical protein JNM09_31055 [Blastocatellia bacterium]|nr:hypothetical protein [Blastocatellia bacterium]